MILDGAKVAAKRRQVLAGKVSQPVKLGIIVATDDSATAAYINQKRKAAEEVNFELTVNELGSEATEADLVAACQEFNRDDTITGYLVQLPLPESVDTLKIFEAVDPTKDADGLTPANLGYLYSNRERILPATPKGILSLLEAYKIPIAGQVATVVGKGLLTGLPIATLLSHRGATVISCDKMTPDLAEQTRRADILISATGQPGLITADMISKRATVIDVGTTPVDGSIRGDVDFKSVEPKAGAVTPVPGGVGPMTVVSLLENVATLAESSDD